MKTVDGKSVTIDPKTTDLMGGIRIDDTFGHLGDLIPESEEDRELLRSAHEQMMELRYPRTNE